MAAPYNDLASKLEAAMKAQAETVSLANRGQAPVHTAVAADTLALPRIICRAEQGAEALLDSGNFEMEAAVDIYSDARGDGSLTAHRSRVAYVFDAFMQDTLADILTAALADFTCIGVFGREMGLTEKEDDHWVTPFRFRAVCCGSDL